MAGFSSASDDAYEAFFRTLPGGPEIADWFGFAPSFHDANMERLELADGSATLVLATFRMTSEVDDRGFFVVDKHALVTIKLARVSAVSLTGNASSIVSRLTFSRARCDTDWQSVAGPAADDIAVSWESSYGLEGVLYAPEVTLFYEPR